MPTGTPPDCRLPLSLLLACLTAAVAGCAQWKSDGGSGDRAGLPPAKLSDELAVMELLFWPVPVAEGADALAGHDPLEAFWSEVDELAVSRSTREALRANGLRAGRITRIEDTMRLVGIEGTGDATLKWLEQASVASEIPHSLHSIPCRPGETKHLSVKPALRGRHPVLVRLGETVIGEPLDEPQYLYALESRAEDDGRVGVRLWPYVEHGQLRQSYVGREQAIRLASGRDRWTLRELTVDVVLGEGQTLIVAPDAKPFGLGKAMFTGGRADGSTETVVMLLRLVRKPVAAGR